MRDLKKRSAMKMKKSLEWRVELYRDSSCIEEYFVKRDLEMPSFRWKIFDIVVFWHKHEMFCKMVCSVKNGFSFFAFGSVAGIVFSIASIAVTYSTDIWFAVYISMTSVMSFLSLIFVMKLMNAGFLLHKI